MFSISDTNTGGQTARGRVKSVQTDTQTPSMVVKQKTIILHQYRRHDLPKYVHIWKWSVGRASSRTSFCPHSALLSETATSVHSRYTLGPDIQIPGVMQWQCDNTKSERNVTFKTETGALRQSDHREYVCAHCHSASLTDDVGAQDEDTFRSPVTNVFVAVTASRWRLSK